MNGAFSAGLPEAWSSLYTEVIRVVQEGRDVCEGFAEVLLFGENVASADQSEVDRISADFGVSPVQVEAGEVSHGLRPRLYWMDWDIPEVEGVRPVQRGARRHVLLFPFGLPACRRWLDKGARASHRLKQLCGCPPSPGR